MEILRSAYSTEVKEQAGQISIPELIQLSTNIPGRAISPELNNIKLGEFHKELINIKKAGKKDKQDKVGVYYVNGTDLHIGNNGEYFSSHKNKNNITVKVDEPKINPENPRIYLPKEKSVGAIVQYSKSEPLPMADNLLHLLLEDKHFKAATAAFFLTQKEDVYGLFRTSASPQADIERARRIIKNMKTVQKEFFWSHTSSGVDMKTANMCVLKEALESYGIKFFHGKLHASHMRQSSPEIHLT